MAVDTADKLVSNILDYICLSKQVPIDVHRIQVSQAETNALVRIHGVLPYNTKVELDEQLLSNGLTVPKSLVPLLRLFREAVNSTNPYYRLLCLYRTGEGLKKAVRMQNNRKVKGKTLIQRRAKRRIPENEYTKEYFSSWIGRSFEEFLIHVEHNFRKNVAHLLIDESLNWVPDPGTAKHGHETDAINGMLLSIIPQLVSDEWAFMNENGIE